MATKSVSKCDCCGRVVENHNAAAGWLHIAGAITRSTGQYSLELGCFLSDHLISDDNDFCSVECLVKALDSRRAPSPGAAQAGKE